MLTFHFIILYSQLRMVTLVAINHAPKRLKIPDFMPLLGVFVGRWWFFSYLKVPFEIKYVLLLRII